MITIKTDEHKFGTICVCALRYAMGRQTYMPELVRDFVRAHLHEIPDETITVMLSDCEFQRKYDDYGDPIIDKLGWVVWEDELKREKKKRQEGEKQ